MVTVRRVSLREDRRIWGSLAKPHVLASCDVHRAYGWAAIPRLRGRLPRTLFDAMAERAVAAMRAATPCRCPLEDD